MRGLTKETAEGRFEAVYHLTEKFYSELGYVHGEVRRELLQLFYEIDPEEPCSTQTLKLKKSTANW